MVGRRLLLYYPTNIVDFWILNKIYVLSSERFRGNKQLPVFFSDNCKKRGIMIYHNRSS